MPLSSLLKHQCFLGLAKLFLVLDAKNTTIPAHLSKADLCKGHPGCNKNVPDLKDGRTKTGLMGLGQNEKSGQVFKTCVCLGGTVIVLTW